MDKKYLPSKKFIARILILVILIAVGFIIYGIRSYFVTRSTKGVGTTLQVKDLVQKDTNDNGIPDWEESLWGLDPNTNGPANKEYILAKREALAKDSSIPLYTNTTASKDTEALSQEFFAVIMSLEQTGNLDDTALKSVSDAIGKKIIADPLPDVYTKDMLVIKNTDANSIKIYYNSLKALFDKYKNRNIGDELSFIATALKNNDQGALVQVGSIGDAYRSFGKDLLKVPVPTALLATHLDLANNYDKVATAMTSLTQLLSNPIVGMKGVVTYKQYDDALLKDLKKITDNLQ